MKVAIDRDGCISCGLCVSTCPEVFEFDDENIATVISSPVPEDQESSAQDAIEGCPVTVIYEEE
jgi:ferredoxin